MTAKPKYYDNASPQTLAQEIANELVIKKYYKNEFMTVGKLSKKLGKTKEEIEGAIKGIWSNLMIYKGNVVCSTWLKFPEYMHHIKN